MYFFVPQFAVIIIVIKMSVAAVLVGAKLGMVMCDVYLEFGLEYSQVESVCVLPIDSQHTDRC